METDTILTVIMAIGFLIFWEVVSIEGKLKAVLKALNEQTEILEKIEKRLK